MQSTFIKLQPDFIAEVEFDPECGMWTVACDRLGVYTEAESYEKLLARFWEIAREMAQENHVPLSKQSRVEFRQNTLFTIAN